MEMIIIGMIALIIGITTANSDEKRNKIYEKY